LVPGVAAAQPLSAAVATGRRPELAKRDLSRQQLLERARLPLRQLVEGRRRKRGA